MPAEATPANVGPWVLDLAQIGPDDAGRAGGKAVALAALRRCGLLVPGGVCVLTGAYDRFVDAAGLRPAIALELGRKPFEDMRWEEVWDASLRIRNLFLRAPLPPDLTHALEEALGRAFGDGRPAVVRSSAPAEDTAATSFAGLHESYVNVQGVAALVDAVRRVWASLWTDRALLYRQELGLDVAQSTMAVVVQELVSGWVSGVAFSQSPLEESQAVVEAVWGLNEGLVDGTIEPDRWILMRDTGDVVEHIQPIRRHKVASSGPDAAGAVISDAATAGTATAGAEGGEAAGGTRLVDVTQSERETAPLSEAGVRSVFAAASAAEDLFGKPQDVEWTVAAGRLHVLQSRPISTLGAQLATEADAIAQERAREETQQILGAAAPSATKPVERDERPWYVNLHRSFGTLRELRHQVEEIAIPQMKAEAEDLATTDLAALSDDAVDAEVARRKEALTRWEEIYYRDFIPLAHGVRLFGQVYNDQVRPADPYEFVDLLTGSGLLSVSRNQALQELAAEVSEATADATQALDDYLDRFGSGPGTPEAVRARERRLLLRLATQMKASDTAETGGATPAQTVTRTEAYLARFQGDERRFQEELLDLARASYRLRDDDNVHLGRFRRLVEAALAEVENRRGGPSPHTAPAATEATPVDLPGPRFQVRQLVGQPAGAGLAIGRARVALNENDLYSFVRGEILVCDSLDPTMTFVAPLAAAIVERRGGMLVHGAIIAREYGLPCVTGVPDATLQIRTGGLLTVDGFLGIVVVGGVPPGTVLPSEG